MFVSFRSFKLTQSEGLWELNLNQVTDTNWAVMNAGWVRGRFEMEEERPATEEEEHLRGTSRGGKHHRTRTYSYPRLPWGRHVGNESKLSG